MPGRPGRIIAVAVGRVGRLAHAGRSHRTAFVKRPIDGPVRLGSLGLEGDEHVFPAHGGADGALLVYPYDHYAFWRGEHGLDLPATGAFAENFTVEGLTETEVCIGDTFAIDDVVIQVSAPRSPCYKIGVRYGDPSLPVVMQEKGNTGYLMRVLTEGTIAAEQVMTLVGRPPTLVSVAEANRVVSHDRDDWPAVERLAAIPELADAVREGLLTRLEAGEAGDHDLRLFGEGEGDPIEA